MNMSEIKKSFKEAFPLATVKIESLDGTYRPYRDATGTMYRLIPTYVTLSPMDCTDVKPKKIAAKFDEIINKLQSLGGILVTRSNNHAMVDFIKPKKKAGEPDKGYRAHIFKESFRSTYIYDSAYQQIFFSVNFEKM